MNRQAKVDEVARAANARFTRLFRVALDHSKPHLKKLLESARGSATNLLADTELMTKFAAQIHRRLPFPTGWIIRRKAFVKFVLSNRDKLAPLLTAAVAEIAPPSQPSSGAND